MNKVYEKLTNCCKSVKEKIGEFRPQIAIVLGTGLNAFGERVEKTAVIDYKDIEGFPVSTVVGHTGRFIFGYVKSVPVVVMQGRVHYYEGYSMEDVGLPIRWMGRLGAEVLFLTNGVGAVNRSYEPGDFMLITDHLSLFVPSPLIGENVEELGTRFPDMTNVYRKELCRMIREAAGEEKIPLREGVYVQLTGPQYETPEEIRLLERLGGDVVGMSTVCEAIAGNHMGMKVCGISAIGNMGAGICDEVLVHEPKDDIPEAFERLVTASVEKISALLSR